MQRADALCFHELGLAALVERVERIETFLVIDDAIETVMVEPEA